MKLDYSHTYGTCVHSMKRTQAPWRVDGGCGNRVCLFTGGHYELPNRTVCVTCPSYCRDTRLPSEEGG